MPSVLHVEELRTEFHLREATVRAVDGVSFSVGEGECVGLVGESGCGKSTTGLSIMKLLPNVGHVTGGSVRLLGQEVVSLSENAMRNLRGNEMAMIFQDPMTSLNPTSTIGRQIAEPVRLHLGASKRQARERALEVLRLVGMPRPEERLDHYPHQLSGGLRQRVMIAMALACEPKLLIADEPTTALDVTIQAQILDLIDDLRARLKMGVLLITHDMGVIASRTDRVMVMYAGKILEGATTDDLFTSMRHPYAEALLSSIPRLDQDRSQRLYSISGLPPDLSRPIVGCRFAPRCRYVTAQCRDEEPLLAPGLDTPSPGAGAPATSSPSLLGANTSGEHVFACFHPLSGTIAERSERLASEVVDAATLAVEAGLVDTTGLSDDETLAGVAGSLSRVSGLGGSATSGSPIVANEVLLEVDHLVKEYSVTAGAVIQRKLGTVKAVSDVSFTVRRGETFGLVGESGCGKTTIGRLVVALERPTAGAVRFEGETISSLGAGALRPRRRDLQLMFQDPYASLDPRMRVGSIIAEPLVVQGLGTRREFRASVRDLLGEVGLAAKSAGLYPHEFSGGQRQRIGLARALALNPKLIVADEPVSALDVSIQAQILNLMRALQDTHQLTYVVISHDLAVVKYLADRIGVMYLGKLVEIGPANDIYVRTAHPYTQGLIDTIPVPDPLLARSRHREAVRGELPSAINPPSGCRFRTRCPFAQEICAVEEPPLRPFGAEHYAACHFPLQVPVEEPAGVGAGALDRVSAPEAGGAVTLSEARGLSEHELAAIGRLEQRVLDRDGGRLKLEWGILRHRSGDHVDDLLWWDGDRLLGFFGIYAFGGPVEITGMVDPEARRQGIGTALLDRALVHSAGRGATEVLLVVPRSGAPGPAFATARGGVLEHSEHFLVLGVTPPGEPRQPDVILRPATATDGAAIQRVLAAAFGNRAGDDLGADPYDRQMVIERAGTVIGTVRVSGEHGKAGIYGFAVDPPFQGRGVGRDVLGRLCVMLRNEGNAEVVLEVAVDNDRAIELYTSVGFEPRATEDYYLLALG